MKPIAIGLTLGLVFIHSVQAGNLFSDVELINTENQRWQFRRVTVNHANTEATLFGWMDVTALPVDARTKVAFHPNKPQPRQKPVHDQTVAR